MKKVVIIAGPNGAGKTTFAKYFLPFEAGCPTFINADLIAAGLSPFNPDAAAFRAGRLMLQEIDRNAAEGNSFAFERLWRDTLTSAESQGGAPWGMQGSSFSFRFERRRTPSLASPSGVGKVAMT